MKEDHESKRNIKDEKKNKKDIERRQKNKRQQQIKSVEVRQMKYGAMILATAGIVFAFSTPEARPEKLEEGSTKKEGIIFEAPEGALPEGMNPDDAAELLHGIVLAAKNGQWALFVGFLVMIATWAMNRFFLKLIPSAVIPWVAIAVGILGQGAFVMAKGGTVGQAIVGGIVAGLTAAGGYSAFGKYFLFRQKPDAQI